jgi:hypothetical protein
MFSRSAFGQGHTQEVRRMAQYTNFCRIDVWLSRQHRRSDPRVPFVAMRLGANPASRLGAKIAGPTYFRISPKGKTPRD